MKKFLIAVFALACAQSAFAADVGCIRRFLNLQEGSWEGNGSSGDSYGAQGYRLSIVATRPGTDQWRQVWTYHKFVSDPYGSQQMTLDMEIQGEDFVAGTVGDLNAPTFFLTTKKVVCDDDSLSFTIDDQGARTVSTFSFKLSRDGTLATTVETWVAGASQLLEHNTVVRSDTNH
jgi:hypothetical protein